MNVSIRIAESVLDTLCKLNGFLNMSCTNQVKALRPEVGLVDLLKIWWTFS